MSCLVSALLLFLTFTTWHRDHSIDCKRITHIYYTMAVHRFKRRFDSSYKSIAWLKQQVHSLSFDSKRKYKSSSLEGHGHTLRPLLTLAGLGWLGWFRWLGRLGRFRWFRWRGRRSFLQSSGQLDLSIGSVFHHILLDSSELLSIQSYHQQGENEKFENEEIHCFCVCFSKLISWRVVKERLQRSQRRMEGIVCVLCVHCPSSFLSFGFGYPDAIHPLNLFRSLCSVEVCSSFQETV